METQDCMCSNEYETHLHHQHSSSVRLQGKNRFLWDDVMPLSPAGMPLPNYWPLLLGNLKLNLNMSWPKMKENLDCLKLRCLICAGIRNEQTDLAGAEEGMVSGSSMWSRKCSEPNCGSFVNLWIFFQSPPSKAARSCEWGRGYAVCLKPVPWQQTECSDARITVLHFKIPRMMCKRRRVCLLTVLTDWKWHQLASTPLRSQQSRS